MEALGPQTCYLTQTSCDKICCNKGKDYCYNYGYDISSTWTFEWQGSNIERLAPPMSRMCDVQVGVIFNCSAHQEKLRADWSSYHTCWYDPENDDYISLDLVDLQATVSKSETLYLSGLILLILGGVGWFILLIFGLFF